MKRLLGLGLFCLYCVGCSSDPVATDAGHDSGVDAAADAAAADLGTDASADAAPLDLGMDAAAPDDLGVDAAVSDLGTDAGDDAGGEDDAGADAALEVDAGDALALGDPCADTDRVCGTGLSCCYPCGIPGCESVCTVTCDESEPACAGGCYLYP